MSGPGSPKPPVPVMQGSGTVIKAVLITLGVLAALGALGTLALAAILGSAMNGIQHMDPVTIGTFGTFAPEPGSSGTDAAPGAATAPAASLDILGDRVCDANSRLSAALLEQGRLLHIGADDTAVAAQGPAVLVPAQEVDSAAALLVEGPAGTRGADLYAVSNSARTLSGLASTAVVLAGRDDQALALSTTYEAWEASAVLDRDLRRALDAEGYQAGAASASDACAGPVDMLGWQRMIEGSTPP